MIFPLYLLLTGLYLGEPTTRACTFMIDILPEPQFFLHQVFRLSSIGDWRDRNIVVIQGIEPSPGTVTLSIPQKSFFVN
jgi:hypothetical protein